MANLITISRLLPLLLTILCLYFGGAVWQALAVPWILILLVMDSIDGLVARRTGQVSKLGSALDIAMDRLVEFVLWVCFSDLGLIPVWVPLVVITRGMITDAVRSYALSLGQTAFDMMHSRLGRFLVASRFMRDLYGVTKVAAFVLLALVHALNRGALPRWSPAQSWLHVVGYTLTVLAVVLCLARGVPVLLDARALFRQARAEQG
ncbi:MAG: CDP-alcohol phosphatidyltransferase family protein [Chloroflexia bacterium]|nr:CDP-alcohol phosphatidyltransferase family protein [Chloroflexia bacterium]